MKARPQAVSRLSAPFRAALHRFAFASLLGLSILAMLASRAELGLMERLRTTVADIFQPVLSVISSPVEAVNTIAADIRGLAQLREENALLRQEVERLRQWYEVAKHLDNENQSLRDLLNFAPPPGGKQVTGRVIADSGGAFVRNLLVSVGSGQGVAKGQTAVTGHGLVGRVTEVGARSARVLLITDLNSRVPVFVDGSRERAILAGDNTALPRLIYLRQEARIAVGDRVYTSGHGGGFPPGIPVGVVTEVGERGVLIRPFVDWQRLESVRLLDYRSEEDAASPAGGRTPGRAVE